MAFVATSSEGVGPGVKILDQMSSRKDAMLDFERDAQRLYQSVTTNRFDLFDKI